MIHKLGQLNKGQAGFTLIELVMATGIASVIASGAYMAIYQVLAVNSRSTIHMTAIKEVEFAINRITPDAQMAQIVSGDILSPNGLTLAWADGPDNMKALPIRLQTVGFSVLMLRTAASRRQARWSAIWTPTTHLTTSPAMLMATLSR